LSFCCRFLVFAAFSLFLIIPDGTKAQVKIDQGLLNPSQTFNSSRYKGVIIGEVVVSSLATLGLQYIWYRKFPRRSFHFFNDNREWQGVDKLGHAATAYNISALQYDLMRWSGVAENKSIIIGGATGIGFQAIVEIMDGFASGWGFSAGDMAANIFGSGLFMAQQFGWKEQRIEMRFSFHSTIYPQYNPALLGNTFRERLLKDYNGQRYWFSFNIGSLTKSDANFPKWITADIGLAARGMTGAVVNPIKIDGKDIPQFNREKVMFFGIGAAFARKDQLPFPSWINSYRIPSPTIEFTKKKVKGNWLTF
jgi:hypothetical protein